MTAEDEEDRDGLLHNEVRYALLKALKSGKCNDVPKALKRLAALGPGPSVEQLSDTRRTLAGELPAKSVTCEAMIVHELDDAAGMEVSIGTLIESIRAFLGRGYDRKFVIKTCARLVLEGKIMKCGARGFYCLPEGWKQAWREETDLNALPERNGDDPAFDP
jgi:hypothetical protein